MIIYDWGWLVGILEGEGCFTVTSPKKEHKAARITVNMTDRDVLEGVANIVGLGKVRGPYKREKAHHKPYYVWAIYGRPAVELMKKVYPYMSERRRIRIAEILTIIEEAVQEGQWSQGRYCINKTL